MASKPLTRTDLSNLQEAIRNSNRSLNVFRDKRADAIKQYVGNNYSNNGAPEAVPLNMIELAVNIYARNLIPGEPRVNVTTVYSELKPAASTFEAAINHTLKAIKLKTTLRDVVMDALFSIGIMKIGLNYSKFEHEGYNQESGRPFALRVDLDDFIVDMSADSLNSVTFIGNKYRMPLEYAKECELFDKKMRKNLIAMQSRTDSSTEAGENSSRISEISQESAYGNTDFIPFVELYDLWLPYQKRFITIPADLSTELPLYDADWAGPSEGPYKLLYFEKVPSQVMPLPSVASWMDLHDAVNDVLSKLIRQASRQKTFTAVGSGSDEDAARVVNASDGEAIRVERPDGIKEISMGGINQQNFSLFGSLRDLSSYSAGNLDSIGGLSAMSATAKQDELINKSASSRVSGMQEDTADFISEVARDIGWYLWTDPLIELPVIKRIGPNVSVQVKYSKAEMDGDFMDYNISIDPYSLQSQTPAEKVQKILSILGAAVYPNMQLLQAQGITLDCQSLMELLSEYSNLPEIKDILTFSSPDTIGTEAGPVGEMPRKLNALMPTSSPSSGPGGLPMASRQTIRSQEMNSSNGLGPMDNQSGGMGA